MNDDDRVVVGSGNVYADFGFDDPEGELAKAKLAVAIMRIIRTRNLTQQDAADLMGIQQPKVSRIVRGRLDGISVDALLEYLRKLGQDVTVTYGASETAPQATPTRMGSFTVAPTYGELDHLPLAANSKARNKIDFS